MSQHANQQNVEKLKRLRAALQMKQAELAALIPLDRGYLSQLENGHKNIDPWIIARVEKIYSERVDKLNTSAMFQETLGEYRVTPTEEACKKHIEAFLERCEKDPAKIGWTLIELREKFPLDKWTK